MIKKDQIEAKLAALKQNKLVVEDRIKTASETIKQANADLNAIAGAIQVCEQLIEENPSEDKYGGDNYIRRWRSSLCGKII